MCIIIDNNCFGDFLDRGEDVRPIYQWLKNQSSKLAHSNHPRFKEYPKKYQDQFLLYLQKGQLKSIDADIIEEKLVELEQHDLKSNDDHIVALCLAAGVKVVFTKDQYLHDDIKQVVKGKIYQDSRHAKLLKRDMCP